MTDKKETLERIPSEPSNTQRTKKQAFVEGVDSLRRNSVRLASKNIIQPMKRASKRVAHTITRKDNKPKEKTDKEAPIVGNVVVDKTTSPTTGADEGDTEKASPSFVDKMKRFIEAADENITQLVKPLEERFYPGFSSEMFYAPAPGCPEGLLFWFRFITAALLLLFRDVMVASILLGLLVAPRFQHFGRVVHIGYAIALISSMMIILRYAIEGGANPQWSDLYALAIFGDQLLSLDHPLWPADVGIFYICLTIYPEMIRPPRMMTTTLGFLSGRGLQLTVLFYLSPILLYLLLLYKKACWNPPSFTEQLGRAWRMSRQGMRLGWDVTRYIPA